MAKQDIIIDTESRMRSCSDGFCVADGYPDVAVAPLTNLVLAS